MESTRRRILEPALGLGLVAALVATVLVVYASFSGRFSDDIAVSAQLAEVGDALQPGDIVTYRDMVVGNVTSATGAVDGTATLGLRIHRADAAVIPAGVSAVAVPASLFGSTKVVLVPPAAPRAARLEAGALIAADTTPAAQSLQTALADAYTLLTAVHPAELDAALSALADALQGQGRRLGTLIAQADGYLERLAPSLPDLDRVITGLVAETDHLARNAPDLLASVADLLDVAKGIRSSKRAVATLLDVAPRAVDDARRLLSPRNVDNAVALVRNEGPVIDAFGADPDALPQTIRGFKSFADTFSPALSSGPYLKVNIVLTGINLAALFNLAAGQSGQVFAAVSDPPEYTAAQCPHYPGRAGPNCSGTATPARGAADDPATASAAALVVGPLLTEPARGSR